MPDSDCDSGSGSNQGVDSHSDSDPDSDSYSDLINHHVPGLLISISATFVAIRIFYKKKSLNVLGYLTYLIAIIACIYLESRSNFIFSIISLLFVIFFNVAMRYVHLCCVCFFKCVCV